MRPTILAISLFAAVSVHAENAKHSSPRIWAVDPLVKVFPDSQPADDGRPEQTMDVARGEDATFQFIFRDDRPTHELQSHASSFARESGGGQLQPQPPRFVGFVPADRPTQTPSKDQLRKPPAEFPDPLLGLDKIDVPAGQAQPIWITVAIPKNAQPGLYRATLALNAETDGELYQARDTSMLLRVHDVTVDHTRLWVTNWFSNCWHNPPTPGDTQYWDNLRKNARMMAEHRQNVAIISPLAMCTFGTDAGGRLTFDWTNFDRAVQLFIDEGVIGRIEGAHLGGRAGDWYSPFVVTTRTAGKGQVQNAATQPSDPSADEFLSKFLPALVSHLREKGWLDRYLQHIADEPIDDNVASYLAIVQLIRKYAPELRIIDAIHSKQLIGKIDVAVPMLNYLHEQYAAYREQPRDGREMWFYTCCQPQGEYANRFLELPLIKTRLLHWINFSYGLTGYLHWGYNFYLPGDPFKQTTASAPAEYWPAGDPYIVYPGPNGPLSSIRFEAMRDGIVDHELLSMLAERDRPAADRLVARHVQDFDKYDTNVAAFRSTRRELLEALDADR